MISIPFSWFGFTDWLIEQEAGLIIMFATFGTLLLTFVVLTILNIVGLKKYSLYIAGALLCSIFISMMVMIPLLLLFSIENSIKLQLVWVVIVASCLIVFLSNRHYLDIYFNSIEKKANKEIKKQNKKRKK
ncbi:MULTISPECIES: hypothetical protein [Providencia]|uniref:Uncharacterized protein n=1 Tax=Providencia rettgeri TaxID=587 RepID=A0AAD2ZK12_PRORE|nr:MULTISPECIES: hypothetical protein [Providencia]ELR5069013.1 hypothetical protein [Providencia rettgeri]ELR5219106.1 hypothetical protein [Providencia rettgeri]ELR5221228.1 hypothetical protein [Providencia rettgeri]MDX7322082.1 hypothetical protein [Providencia rettgeri]UPS63795.1 hypothetical protein M0M83_04405 [Providencia rettgeri]